MMIFKKSASPERYTKKNGKQYGPGGRCVCAVCGHIEEHKNGIPCNTLRCAECGAKMTREHPDGGKNAKR